MATPKQIAANRKNAQKSTGPRSTQTKAKVSRNRLVHGLCARFQVLEEVESQEDFDTFLKQLMDDEKPVGQAEIELVVKMAQHTWLSKRAVYMQNQCFVPQPKTPQQEQNREIPFVLDASLERCLRYHVTHDRAYQRASAELQKRKKERRLAEIGFESQKRAQAEEIRKTEKHALAMLTANFRKQREEIKLATALAKILPPDFDLSPLSPLASGSENWAGQAVSPAMCPAD